MSYTIIYDKKFVKTEKGIIPIVLAGSNNCYMVNHRGQEVRSREWGPFRFAQVPMSAEDIMAEVNGMVPSTYNEHFVYNSKWVDDKGFVSFFESGIKNAMTLEEILDKYLAFNLNVKVFAKDLESTKEWPPSLTLFNEFCKDNASLEAALEQAVTILNAQPEEAHAHIDYSFGASDGRLETRHKRRGRSRKPADTGFIILLSNGNYFKKRSSCHMWHTPYEQHARAFRSYEEAEAYLQKDLRGYDIAATARIIAKKFVICTDDFKEYWAGNEFIKKAIFAKPFNTEKQAEAAKDSAELKLAAAGKSVIITTHYFEAGAYERSKQEA